MIRDADTLDEVWPESRPYGDYWWVEPAALRADDWPLGSRGESGRR